MTSDITIMRLRRVIHRVSVRLVGAGVLVQIVPRSRRDPGVVGFVCMHVLGGSEAGLVVGWVGTASGVHVLVHTGVPEETGVLLVSVLHMRSGEICHRSSALSEGWHRSLHMRETLGMIQILLFNTGLTWHVSLPLIGIGHNTDPYL